MSETAAKKAIAPEHPESIATQVPSSGRIGLRTDHGVRSKPGGVARQAIYVLIDLVMVCLSALAVYFIRFDFFYLKSGQNASPFIMYFAPSARYEGFLILYAALIVLSCIGQGLYSTPRGVTPISESVAVAKAVGLATVVLVLFIFTSGNKEISRIVVICSGFLNIVTLSGWRYAKRKYVSRRLQRGIGTQRTLIIGANKLGHDLAACFEQNHELGYDFCGFLDPHVNGDAAVLGTVTELRRVALAQFADAVFVTLPADREMVKEVFVQAQSLRLDLHIVPDVYDGLALHAPIRTIGGFPALNIHGQPIPATGLAIKRIVDVVLAALGLIVTAPLLLMAAVLIACDSPGPIFYTATRVGRKGRRFACHKLRTMIANAETEKEMLRKNKNERTGPLFKMNDDPRITRSGYWLRRFSVDELPQLFNVLLGDMSLVGPRPHPVDDFEHYSFEDMRRLEVKPGVTGLWQVTARCDPSFETSMKLDLEYIEKWSLWLDLRILARTIPEVFRASGR
jgi:exopolysaccharide biosynthesis polyprenyl glycosylphosphotransferase